MLPTLKQFNQSRNQQTSRTDFKMTSLAQSKAAVQLVRSYQQKYESQIILNQKLNQLLNNIRSNFYTNVAIHEQQDEIAKLLKQRRKQQTEVQHQAHILNILVSQNEKLKRQVDSERNKRAIYFNVYKNLEHEIHHWEGKYKCLLIESLRTQGTIAKVKQKFRKATKKAEKQIQSLNQQLQKLGQFQNLSQTKNEKTLKSKASSKQILLPETKLQSGKQAISFTETTDRQQKLGQTNSQQYRKSLDHELEYQLQQKSVYVSGIINRLKNITGVNDLHEIYKLFKDINDNVEYQYDLFKNQQKRQKQLLQKIQACKLQLTKIQAENIDRKSSRINDISGANQLTKHNQKIRELQIKLQQKIGVKVSELPNQMLLHQCLIVRDQKVQNKKNLQKYLQQTKKQKPQHSVLLSPNQMHRKIVQCQANFI